MTWNSYVIQKQRSHLTCASLLLPNPEDLLYVLKSIVNEIKFVGLLQKLLHRLRHM